MDPVVELLSLVHQYGYAKSSWGRAMVNWPVHPLQGCNQASCPHRTMSALKTHGRNLAPAHSRIYCRDSMTPITGHDLQSALVARTYICILCPDHASELNPPSYPYCLAPTFSLRSSMKLKLLQHILLKHSQILFGWNVNINWKHFISKHKATMF